MLQGKRKFKSIATQGGLLSPQSEQTEIIWTLCAIQTTVNCMINILKLPSRSENGNNSKQMNAACYWTKTKQEQMNKMTCTLTSSISFRQNMLSFSSRQDSTGQIILPFLTKKIETWQYFTIIQRLCSRHWARGRLYLKKEFLADNCLR